jgi:hypothetical protein
VIAESNTHIMERFTREFLPTGDAALGEQFISRDIVSWSGLTHTCDARNGIAAADGGTSGGKSKCESGFWVRG